MKCRYCGAELTEGQKYCVYCGTRQDQAAVPQAMKVPCESKPVAAAPAVAAKPAVPVMREEHKIPETSELDFLNEFIADKPVRAGTCLQLPTQRGLGKMFFLGILTCGIYPTVIWSRIVTELNLAASRYDGKRTMPYFGMCMLATITLGIYPLVWIHNFCNRIGAELERRNIEYEFGARTFWLWGVLGSLILAGPFVFTHKLMKSMNQINKDFNNCG